MTIGNSYLDGLRNTAQAAGATTPKSNKTLDQTAFLKLMTTQLKTQDPFDPVDNTQMVAQMAQFSSTTGIAEMNASLKTLVSSLTGTRVGDAANWIGRAALVPTDTAAPLSDGSYAGEIALPKDADNVQISLVDANGAVVHQETLGERKAGNIAFRWNGKDDGGNVIANGPLTIKVTAANAAGNIETASSAWTQVTAVQSPAGGADTKLVTPLGLLDPADALRLG